MRDCGAKPRAAKSPTLPIIRVASPNNQRGWVMYDLFSEAARSELSLIILSFCRLTPRLLKILAIMLKKTPKSHHKFAGAGIIVNVGCSESSLPSTPSGATP